ncbi:MAG TPA: gliding motility-associated C-terminal domain-containing protein, partial [Chitinophagaceae bacterium]|nr:gliding motility-associated C-terminal domain-containing protein [Chitinophagaceae bacterium]
GDGKNDLLRILGGSIAHMDWQIWNRWGQLVFATKNRTAGWDGNFGGRPQPSGSFVFYLRVVLKSGSVIHKKGMVTLVR